MRVDQSPLEIASPCVGICQLQGPLCIGCGRLIEEIMQWPGSSEGKKLAIVASAQQRLAIILKQSALGAGEA